MSNVYRFKFHGNGFDLFVLFLVNAFLCIITFSLYVPWARTNVRKYLIENSSFAEKKFVYHGTGSELFRGYILVICAYFFYLLLANFAVFLSMIFAGICFCLIPILVFRSYRYRLSRISWNGAFFNVANHERAYTRDVFLTFILAIPTFNLYVPFGRNNRMRTLINATSIGNVPFRYRGEGKEMFGIYFKNFFLCVITLGLYFPWAWLNIRQYIIDHSRVGPANFRLNLTGSDIILFFLIQLLAIPTFGLAIPWIYSFNFAYIANRLELWGELNLERISGEGSLVGATGDAASAFGGLSLDL